MIGGDYNIEGMYDMTRSADVHPANAVFCIVRKW